MGARWSVRIFQSCSRVHQSTTGYLNQVAGGHPETCHQVIYVSLHRSVCYLDVQLRVKQCVARGDSSRTFVRVYG